MRSAQLLTDSMPHQARSRWLGCGTGRVAIELPQAGADPHILAVLEAEELLGELGLFGSGRHSADVRVLDGPACTLEVEAGAFLRTLLFDVELAMELLALVCRRCSRPLGRHHHHIQHRHLRRRHRYRHPPSRHQDQQQ